MVDVLFRTGILYILGINHCRRDGRWFMAGKGKDLFWEKVCLIKQEECALVL